MKLIYRIDNAIDATICETLSVFLINAKRGKINKFGNKILPWSDNDTISWNRIEDLEIKNIISNIKIQITDIVSQHYGVEVFPNFTDLVLWRSGRYMGFHKDNGYTDDDGLHVRKFSTVLYLNDNFTGGETVIVNEDGSNYISHPKIGSLLMFVSDDRCIHKVNKIISGSRTTLATWFAIDKTYEEC